MAGFYEHSNKPQGILEALTPKAFLFGFVPLLIELIWRSLQPPATWHLF
jgi:hypothetical protein